MRVVVHICIWAYTYTAIARIHINAYDVHNAYLFILRRQGVPTLMYCLALIELFLTDRKWFRVCRRSQPGGMHDIMPGMQDMFICMHMYIFAFFFTCVWTLRAYPYVALIWLCCFFNKDKVFRIYCRSMARRNVPSATFLPKHAQLHTCPTDRKPCHGRNANSA